MPLLWLENVDAGIRLSRRLPNRAPVLVAYTAPVSRWTM